MEKLYTRAHLERAIKTYIKFRELDGLSRDTAVYGAVEEVIQQAALEQSVLEEMRLIQSKRQTDKLNPPREVKQ